MNASVPRPDAEVAVVGAGVVGAATALELARRGASVALVEAADEPALAASATNSGIWHTGFDSVPGELETRCILRSAELREDALGALGAPLERCGALMLPLGGEDLEATHALARNAERNGVEVQLRPDGSLLVPGEAVTDPAAYVLALVAAAERHGAELRTGFRVVAAERAGAGVSLRSSGGDSLTAWRVVNCAGLGGAALARLFGDASFEVYPRKGEFLVFEPAEPLERILLPVPSPGTKGVIVFPTLDGMVVAGPTAVDGSDPEDWSVRPAARAEILAKAAPLHPPLADSEPVFSYAGLRPAGRGTNYVIGPSRAHEALINVAAIRSTGLSASLGIAELVAGLVERAGVALAPREPIRPGEPPPSQGPWWRRVAERRGTHARSAP